MTDAPEHRRSIYISGPMTGIPLFNFPAFDAARDLLVAQGWDVYSPADYDREVLGFDEHDPPENFDYQAALAHDLEVVADADAIYMLNDAIKSKGARAEMAYAAALGKQIIYQEAHEAPRVIGLGGRLRAGKDAAADYLVDHHGFVKLGMSDPLHEALLAIDPLVDAYSHGYSAQNVRKIRYSEVIEKLGYVEAKKSPEVRGLLQRLGTEVGRKLFGEDAWVDIAVRRINELTDAGHSVVITGLRFPNEVAMFDRIHATNRFTAWVSRPAVDNHPSAAATHDSEKSVSASDFDQVLLNDGALEDLYANLETLIDHDTKE